MNRTPNARENDKAKEVMQKGVDDVIQDKKDDRIGTEEAKRNVADQLHDAAEKDIYTRRK